MDDKKKKELTDEEVKDTSGGGWLDADNDYESGDTPRYKVGDHVRYRVLHWSSKEFIDGVVTSVSTSKSGVYHTEFTYSVKKDSDGTTENDVYESQIVYGKRGM